MKILFILLMCNISISFAQVNYLNRSYEDIIRTLKEDPSIYNFVTVNINSGYTLNTNSTDKDYIKNEYYFNNQNICYLIVRYKQKRILNTVINVCNDYFVKTDILKWRDYKTNSIIEIEISENFFTEIYYLHKN